MIAEDELQRRGEPVIVNEKPGTIEWGGVTQPASVYLEQGGRMTGVPVRFLRADPGGERPVWQRIQPTTSQRIK